jgi:hypothetical protein
MNFVKKLISILFPANAYLFLRKVRLGWRLAFSKRSYLVQTGYIDSKVSSSLTDNAGQYVPWMNYPFISFIADRIQKNHIIFEYGSGFSSAFFAKRCRYIVSVEYNEQWYKHVKEVVLKEHENGQVYYQHNNETYASSIGEHMQKGSCDIIIIDGYDREHCARTCIDYLSDRGVIIFDDSHRNSYKRALQFYKERGFKTVHFEGMKPTGFGKDETTIIYREQNCLNL